MIAAINGHAEAVKVLHGLGADLVFPGARIAGRFADYKATGQQTLTFKRESESVPLPDSLIAKIPKATVTVPVSAEGTYFVDGLWPGTWSAYGSPRPLRGASGGSVRFEVPVGRAAIDLELALEP